MSEMIQDVDIVTMNGNIKNPDLSNNNIADGFYVFP